MPGKVKLSQSGTPLKKKLKKKGLFPFNSCPKHPYSRCACHMPRNDNVFTMINKQIPTPVQLVQPYQAGPPTLTRQSSNTLDNEKDISSGLFRINDCPSHPYSRCACHFERPQALFLEASSQQQLQQPQHQQLQQQQLPQQINPNTQMPITPQEQPDTELNLSKDEMTALSQAWWNQARGEQVSVYGFEAHHDELKQFEAPEKILKGVLRARDDEVRHTRLCMLLATRFAPDGKQPDPPIVERTDEIAGTLEELVTKLTCEGCWGETLGTLVASRQYKTTTDQQVKKALETVIGEEAFHCILAWDTIVWAINRSEETSGKIFNHFKSTIATLQEASAPSVPEVTARDDGLSNLEDYGIIDLKTMNHIQQERGPALAQDLLAHLIENTHITEDSKGKTNDDNGDDDNVTANVDANAVDFGQIVYKHIQQIIPNASFLESQAEKHDQCNIL